LRQSVTGGAEFFRYATGTTKNPICLRESLQYKAVIFASSNANVDLRIVLNVDCLFIFLLHFRQSSSGLALCILPYYLEEVELISVGLYELSDNFERLFALTVISRFSLEYALSFAESLTRDSTT
jgi:hypothetical protein